MYLKKYEIKGEVYVKLDELNKLMTSEQEATQRKLKERRAKGEDTAGLVGAYCQTTYLARKVNLSEDGDKWIIFRRDVRGEWEYFMQLVKWNDIPEFVRRHFTNQYGEYAVVGTCDIGEATLFDCIEDAQDALAAIEAECKEQAGKWHITKKWMFDTKENRESLLMLFYDGGEEKAKDKPKKRRPRCPGRYSVWYRDDGETTQHCMGFMRMENGMPVFTNRPCMAKKFAWRGEAEAVANICGEGFEVVDMIDQMTAEERLLRAIFREDGMDGEPEYHGDGTKAEDEDWDGEEE